MGHPLITTAGKMVAASRNVRVGTPNKRISHGANRVANPGAKGTNDGTPDEGMKGAAK